jgi:hypothetical protein
MAMANALALTKVTCTLVLPLGYRTVDLLVKGTLATDLAEMFGQSIAIRFHLGISGGTAHLSRKIIHVSGKTAHVSIERNNHERWEDEGSYMSEAGFTHSCLNGAELAIVEIINGEARITLSREKPLVARRSDP